MLGIFQENLFKKRWIHRISLIRYKILMKCLLLLESNISELCSGETGQEQENEQLCEILAFYFCSGAHDTKQLPYFVQQLVAFWNSSFWCFLPQLEINMDWRQNCLIDLHFSRYSFCYISLSPITADLVAASLCGETFLFFPFLTRCGRDFLFVNFVILEGGPLNIFTHRYRRSLHQKRAPKL